MKKTYPHIWQATILVFALLFIGAMSFNTLRKNFENYGVQNSNPNEIWHCGNLMCWQTITIKLDNFPQADHVICLIETGNSKKLTATLMNSSDMILQQVLPSSETDLWLVRDICLKAAMNNCSNDSSLAFCETAKIL